MGDDLFEVDTPAAGPRAARAVPVSKTFRAFAPDQMLLLLPSLDEWLAEDHLARFVAEVVDEVLDLTRSWRPTPGVRAEAVPVGRAGICSCPGSRRSAWPRPTGR